MKKYFRKYLYDFITLNKSEQRGIVVFISLSLLLTAISQILPYFNWHRSIDHSDYIEEIALFRNSQRNAKDSIQIEILQNTGQLNDSLAAIKIRPFVFNPNKLPFEKWKALGLSEKQIKTILKYEAKGGTFRKKEDVAKIYVISEAEYKILEPFISIPELKNKPKPKTKWQEAEKTKVICSPVELNSADSSQLVTALSISPWLAVRLIKFRNILGGYSSKEQLFEVYGFDSLEVRQRLPYVSVDTLLIKKLDLNSSSFKQLIRHPYITYELAGKISDQRKKKKSKLTPNLILEKGLISEKDFKKLKPYLK